MESGSTNGPSAGSMKGSGQMADNMDVDAEVREQGGYSYSASDRASSTQTFTGSNNSESTQHRPPGGWSDDTDSHLAQPRIDGISLQTIHTGTTQGVASAASFGSTGSVPLTHGHQHSPRRGQMFVGGQPQGLFVNSASNQPSIQLGQQKSTVDVAPENRNTVHQVSTKNLKPFPTVAKNSQPASSLIKSQAQSKFISSSAVGSTVRGGAVFPGSSPPATSSQGALRPAVLSDFKQPTSRQVIGSGNPHNGPPGPASGNKSRELYGPGSASQQSAAQKGKSGESSMSTTSNVLHQIGGPPSRNHMNSAAIGSGPPIQLPRAANRSTTDTMKSLTSTQQAAISDKSKRLSAGNPQPSYEAQSNAIHRPGMPSNPTGSFNNPVGMGKTQQHQHQHQQLHHQNQHGQQARRMLPMAGSQASQMMPPAGAAASPSQKQGPASPSGVRESVPAGAMSFRNRMDDPQQQHRDHASRQQHPMQSTPQSSAAHQPPPNNGAVRELRVEDALYYLDDVKREFKDRPAIYNEFLAIMKNFKSQAVDTPGVIARVSKLFRGYNSLILGFNTFLPDGYKISLADLERQEEERSLQESVDRKKAAKAVPNRASTKARKPAATVKPAPLPLQPSSNQGQLSPMLPVQMQSQPQPQPQPQPQQQQQQQQQLQQAPSRLAPPSGFRGRSPDEPLPRQSAQQPNSMIPTHPASIPASRPSPPLSQLSSPAVAQSNVPPTRPAMQVQIQDASLVQSSTTLPPSQFPQHPAVEFDHAISYVTTIKKRFANDPGTYHSFLEILHTYQKEQRGIKEVLEQVAHLFQDHPDLLKEFTFFLPDAVQEQAKERLHRAAAESELRQAAQRQQTMEEYHNRMGGQLQQDQQNLVDMTKKQAQEVEPDIRSRKRLLDGQPLSIVNQPEAPVYNSAVERQFFDSARDALSSFTRDGGQAWSEFLKCLDMYAQEILSRSEMLTFVEPLLGKRNNSLFEEFKRILNAAGNASGSTSLLEDSWYSVPLAEIDFSRCRRCSPSYRALPRDYPAHPCSERSEFEAKWLNDVWVSLPVGSEESYTFRHMRRNTYEETLFRVEDERFEIDMALDSNKATLHRLEPIAEEIAQLARCDILPTDLGIEHGGEALGLGGKRFQYTFDKSILGVIHRNAIARIYGDSGKEMLQLLERNPTVAVPLVLNRLRQKHSEWIKVRARLNRHWKELAEQNYYKSLDHRSLTWRTFDKRSISTRALIAEIKDLAANNGREGKEAHRQKLDKAKEEHGTFFEVTVGSKLDQDLDLTYLPKPDRRLFTPHQSLLYQNVSWAQRDAYRILTFALERGQISPADKERCHRLWVEFLGPWFGLSLTWMQKPAAQYQESIAAALNAVQPVDATVVSEDDDDESVEEGPGVIRNQVATDQTVLSAQQFSDHHPLPAGAFVSTLYGEGKVAEFRRTDHIYKVKLSFGAVGYLRPTTVLCSMLPVENSASTRQLRTEDKTKLPRPNDQLAFGTQSLFLFFRLHHVLIQRLNIAKQLAYSVGSISPLQSLVEQVNITNPKAVGKLRYEAYISLLYSLLDGCISGTSDGGKYEDRVRSLLGHGAYELSTMDKLISHIWKDIQTMANDENMWNLVQLYRRHLLAGSFQPEAFRQEAAYISEGEPLFAFQHCPILDSDESVLHMEYVGVMDDEDDDAMDELHETTDQISNKRLKK